MVVRTYPTSAETKLTIRELVRNNFRDPYSIKDAAISNSWQTDRGLSISPTYFSVCIKFNSKNKFGGYNGRRKLLLAFQDAKIIETDFDSELCDDTKRAMTYEPFQEIMNIK